MRQPRLDLPAIELSLQNVQRPFTRINAALTVPRDPMQELVISNMLAGYRFLDELQEANIDIFAIGNSKYLLDLNCLVLCGNVRYPEAACAPHFQETERRFYDDSNPGGVRAFMNHLADHQEATIWRRAARVYLYVLSSPQLFFEGNHRTGVLLMSHLLLRGGEPPFVITTANARHYFDQSSSIKGCRKQTLRALLDMPRLLTHFAELLKSSSDSRYLRSELKTAQS